MKKIIALMMSLLVVFSFAACSDDGEKVPVAGSSDASAPVTQGKNGFTVLNPDLIGEWVVTGSDINAPTEILNMQFELVRDMAYFEGAKITFDDEGNCSLNDMVNTYKFISKNEIQSVNPSDNAVTNTKFTINGNTMEFELYANQFVVYMEKQ